MFKTPPSKLWCHAPPAETYRCATFNLKPHKPLTGTYKPVTKPHKQMSTQSTVIMSAQSYKVNCLKCFRMNIITPV